MSGGLDRDSATGIDYKMEAARRPLVDPPGTLFSTPTLKKDGFSFQETLSVPAACINIAHKQH